MTPTKICRTCRQPKPRALFYRHPNGADGLMSDCTQCIGEQRRKYRAANREKINAYLRQYNQRPERREVLADYERLKRARKRKATERLCQN